MGPRFRGFDMVIVMLCRDGVTARRQEARRQDPAIMVRAALLRRSCDGVAAATELRRPTPSRSFCASRLSDATGRMMRSAFISPVLIIDLNLKGSRPTVLLGVSPPPYSPVISTVIGTSEACRPKISFLCTPFVARILTLRSQKSGHGLLLDL